LLLLRVKAVHASSWLWPVDAPSITLTAKSKGKPKDHPDSADENAAALEAKGQEMRCAYGNTDQVK